MTTQRAVPGPSENIDLAEVRERPLPFLAELLDTYGDIVGYRADQWRAVVLNRPEWVKQVLVDKWQQYVKEGTPDLMMLKPMLGEGIMTSEGESWFAQRRILFPAFHGEKVRAFSKLMTTATTAMLARWEQIEGPIEIEAEMTRLTLEIVAGALFGFDMRDSEGDFGEAVRIMNHHIAHFDPRNHLALKQFAAARGTVRRLAERIIEERRQAAGDDLVSLMIGARDEDTGEGMSDSQIADQVFTMLMAGHETTSKALTWALYCLDQNPEVAARLCAELDAVLGDRLPTDADLAQLPYTAKVLDEAMRIYPPVWLVTRMSTVDDQFGEFHVPKGTMVLLSPFLLHRHPELWPEPLTFDPERFNKEAEAERQAFAYMPFGGGPRTCIGRSFANVETRLVLATICQRYRLERVANHPVEPEALVTLRPRFGLKMNAHVR